MNDFDIRSQVLKIDENLGLVLGWAIVCKLDGQDYYDSQGDHIPEDAMLEAAADFAKSARAACEMHSRDTDGNVVEAGTVLFAWPMTQDIADAFGMITKRTGLMIGMKPEEGMLEKFRNGTLTGFSIGGKRIEDEVVE